MAAAPYPAYSPKSPLALGSLKLPVLAASTSLRRSRQAGAARMDAGRNIGSAICPELTQKL
ncbi:LysR family transcriptional regulator [Klebsiella pneumoniae]|nr:LysR family transcriptional regulator [Klebsiella pneumoniae]